MKNRHFLPGCAIEEGCWEIYISSDYNNVVWVPSKPTQEEGKIGGEGDEGQSSKVSAQSPNRVWNEYFQEYHRATNGAPFWGRELEIPGAFQLSGEL